MFPISCHVRNEVCSQLGSQKQNSEVSILYYEPRRLRSGGSVTAGCGVAVSGKGAIANIDPARTHHAATSIVHTAVYSCTAVDWTLTAGWARGVSVHRGVARMPLTHGMPAMARSPAVIAGRPQTT